MRDPPNLEATFFAVLSLGYVGGLNRVKRLQCLKWLTTLQRDDGSFGELVGPDGRIEGGRDMRHCFVAVTIWKILRGGLESEKFEYSDINIENLVNHIRFGETYDGGLSEDTEHESHGGYTNCAIATLSLIDRLPTSKAVEMKRPGLTNLPATIRWLVARQIEYIEEEDDDDEQEEADDLQELRERLAGVYKDNSASKGLPCLADASSHGPIVVGFNGRLNKPVDTCYCFWATASLDMLGQASLINKDGCRLFLLDKTQHRIGGFGKSPGYPPDIYHSYLGLATLAILKEPGLKPVDPAICISIQARQNIEKQIASIDAHISKTEK